MYYQTYLEVNLLKNDPDILPEVPLCQKPENAVNSNDVQSQSSNDLIDLGKLEQAVQKLTSASKTSLSVQDRYLMK